MIWSRDIVWYMHLNIIISVTLTKKIKLFKKNPTYFLAIAAINTCNHNVSLEHLSLYFVFVKVRNLDDVKNQFI